MVALKLLVKLFSRHLVEICQIGISALGMRRLGATGLQVMREASFRRHAPRLGATALQVVRERSFGFGAIRRGFFVQRRGRCGITSPATDGEFALAQDVQYPQLFRNGPGGQLAPEGAFAFQDFFQIKAHGARNCLSNFSHA